MGNRALVRIQGALATLCAAMTILTAAWPDWIERVTPLDPDQHNGSLELMLIALFAASTLVLGYFARKTWRASRSTG